MHSVLHSLHIGTLATWLSVAGFGTVGVVIHGRDPSPARPEVSETQLIPEDFTLGDDSAPAAMEPETAAPVPAETLPTPPELPALAEIEPLPAIPDFAPPAAEPADAPSQAKPITRSAPAARSSGMPSGKTAPSTRQGTGNSGSGATDMSDAARIAAGHKPKPPYPAKARQRNQTGIVHVTFTVGTDGRVISAYASKPCPYPLLNYSAVAGVRRWKFPPGGIMTKTQPITYNFE